MTTADRSLALPLFCVSRRVLCCAWCCALLTACGNPRPASPDATAPPSVAYDASGPSNTATSAPGGATTDADAGPATGITQPQPTIPPQSLPPQATPPPAVPPPAVPPACVPSNEVLDGLDNDCDSVRDEGFWAVPTLLGDGELVAAHHQYAAAQPRTIYGFSASHRLCVARGYVGGFGPVEKGPDTSAAVCLADAAVQALAIEQLTARHAECVQARAFSIFCSSAIHRHCALQGYASGVGPVEYGASGPVVICVQHASVRTVTLPELQVHHASCDGSDVNSLFCAAAINRYCQAAGAATGFGPVEVGAGVLYVACLNAS